MSEALKAPEGCQWRPSLAVAKVLILERVATCDQIGSIEPKRGKWINRDTGEPFDTQDRAMQSVEAWA